jgi:hypothetical protein
MTPTADPELLDHFTVVICPFHHDLTSADRAPRLQHLARRWAPWWVRLDDREAAATLDAGAFFLPHVRELLHPEIAALRPEPPGERYAHWVARLRRLSGEGAGTFAAHMPVASALRLTLQGTARAPLSRFRLARRLPYPARGEEEIPARLDWADVLLFPSGLGFLLLKVHLDRAQPHLGELVALNSGLRVLQPSSLLWQPPRLRFAQTELTVQELFHRLTAGLSAGDAGSDDLLDAPPCDRDLNPCDREDAYGERANLLSYACVHLDETARAAIPAGAFPVAEDRLLFEYAACIGLGESVHNPAWVPSPEQVERVRKEHQFALWRCWKGMAFKESLVFLGLEDVAFNRRALPNNVEGHYLPLYLHTLHQKYLLLDFAHDLRREVSRGGTRVREARALTRRYVAFRSQYWFDEVTSRPQGGDLYRSLHRGLELQALHQQVATSVKEVKDYYEGVRARWVQTAKDVVTYGSPVGVGLTTLHVSFFTMGATAITSVLLTLLTVVALTGVLCLWFGWRPAAVGAARRTAGPYKSQAKRSESRRAA